MKAVYVVNENITCLEGIDDKDSLIKQLRTENFQLRNIIENLPGSIYWKDKNGVYLGRNKHSAQWMNEHHFEEAVDTDYVVGKTDFDFFDAQTANMFRENDRQVMQAQEKLVLEEEVTLPNGDLEIQLSTKAPLYNEQGEVAGIVGNTVYITHLKKIQAELRIAKEQAEAASQAKTEFIRNMEHDIRTPFSGVWIIADELSNNEQEPEKKAYLKDIASCAKELLDYCNSILDYSRIELGALPNNNMEMNVLDVVDKIIRIETPVARQKQISLIAEYGENIPGTLIGDELRLTRILLNLVSNAMKFTLVGGVKVSVKLAPVKNAGAGGIGYPHPNPRIKCGASPTSPDRGRGLIDTENSVNLQFIIEDTGIGIPEDKLDIIFEKFSRLSTSNRGEYKGTGLGLAIVKVLVDELHGNIEVESELNKGTRFIINLPFELRNDDAN